MRASIDQILRRSQPGTSGAVKGHISRARQISEAIGARWGAAHAHPYHWRLKHVRWYLEAECRGLAPATRHDHWRTIRAVLSVLGKWPGWRPRLKGPWCHRTGRAGNGPGGRPAKLALRGRTTTE